MSGLLFNWGGLTPEQAAMQQKLEELALMEQAIRIRMSRTGQSAGVGGGSLLTSTLETDFILVPGLGETNYTYYIADYRKATISGPLDTGISIAEYNYSSSYSIYNKGYWVLFNGIADANNYVLLFTDAAGNILDTVTGYTSDLSYSTIEGRWVVVTDYDARYMWYFDGETVTTDLVTLQAADSSFSIGADGDFCSNDGFGITLNKTNGDKVFCIANNSGVTEIFTGNTTTLPSLEWTLLLYNYSGVAVVREYNASDSVYSSLRFFNVSTGAQIGSTVDVSEGQYTDVDYFFYGEGNQTFIFSSTSERLVVHYNATLNSIEQSETISVADYPNFWTNYLNLSLFDYNDQPINNTMAITFYDSEGIYDYGLEKMYAVKILNSINGSALSMYDLALPGDGGLPRIATPRINKNHITYLAELEEGGVYSILSLTQNDSFIFPSEISLTDYSEVSHFLTGEKTLVKIDTTAPASNILVVNSAGDSCTASIVTEETINQEYVDHTIMVFKSPTREWRLDNSTDSLVEIDRFDTTYTSSGYTNPTLTSAGVIMEIKRNVINYTHTQMISVDGEAAPEDFAEDGVVVAGGPLNFGTGSTYFTNMHPGLFVLCAKDIAIDSFSIGGNIGADGNAEAIVETYQYSTTVSGQDYKAYVKRVGNTGDPSINQIIIVPGDGTGISQLVDTTAHFDTHVLTGLSGISEIHYLLLAQRDGDLGLGVVITDADIDAIVEIYLGLAHGNTAQQTLDAVAADYTTITAFPPFLYLFNDSVGDFPGEISDGGNDMYDGANVITTNLSIPTMRIITNSSTAQVSGVPSNTINISVGPELIGFAYPDPLNADLKISAKYYDHSGNLKHYIKTPHFDETWFAIIGTRVLMIALDKEFDGETTYANTTIYMVTPSNYKSIDYNSLDVDGYVNVLPNDTVYFD